VNVHPLAQHTTQLPTFLSRSLKVSLRVDDDALTMTWSTFKFIFLNLHSLALWTIPLGLAIFLRVITHQYHHQLIFPLCALCTS
jgi:SulP family sulfate permease